MASISPQVTPRNNHLEAVLVPHESLDEKGDELKEGEKNVPAPVQNVFQRTEVVIKHLRVAKEIGLKVGIFVGRREEQSIPNEQGWLWCSLDHALENPLPGRLHFSMDFNDSNAMQQIQGLFDKVVLDISTLRSLNDPWLTLKNLVVHEPHAEIIAESLPGCGIVENIDDVIYDARRAKMTCPTLDLFINKKRADKAYDAWEKALGAEQVEAEFQQFLSSRSPDSLFPAETIKDQKLDFKNHILKTLPVEKIDRRPGFLEAIRDHLKGLFHEVTLVDDTPFPYQDGPVKEQHWVLRNPN
jgi:hypothetical protein